MPLKLLQLLSLCLAIFVQLTSSQPADDVTQPNNNVNSCGLSENFERTVLTALTELQIKLAKLEAARAPGSTTGTTCTLRNQTDEKRNSSKGISE